MLNRNIGFHEQHNAIIRNKYNAVEKKETIHEQRIMQKEDIQQASKEIIQEKTRQAKQKWMTEFSLQLIEKKTKRKEVRTDQNKVEHIRKGNEE